MPLATDEAFLDKDGNRQQRMEWQRIVVIGNLALTGHEHLRKGRQIFVEGRLHAHEWESSGVTSRRTEIVASRVQFLEAPATEEADDAPSKNIDSSLEMDEEAPA